MNIFSLFYRQKPRLPFYQWEGFVKGEIQVDLCEPGVEAAMVKLSLKFPRHVPDAHLIVGESDAVAAGRLAERFKIKSVVVLPSEIFRLDAWCLLTDAGNFYSTGA